MVADVASRVNNFKGGSLALLQPLLHNKSQISHKQTEIRINRENLIHFNYVVGGIRYRCLSDLTDLINTGEIGGRNQNFKFVRSTEESELSESAIPGDDCTQKII